MRNIIMTVLMSLAAWLPAQDFSDKLVDQLDEEAFGRGEGHARITYAGKHSYIQREREQEPELLIRNMQVISGDSVETRANAKIEIEFIDGSLFQVANRTNLEFQAINERYDNESLTVVKLYDGSIFLHTTDVSETLKRRVIRVDSESGSVYLEAPGIYRIDMETDRMRLRVYRGFAELAGEEASQAVYSGEYATIRNMVNPSLARPFNSFRADHFERWAYNRRPSDSVSAKYVDPSLASYARDLDENGSWRYDSEVSTHVWVPYVDSGWRPYNAGFWSDCGPYMSWNSYDPFGYLTHHYGRWLWRAALGWYWFPGYRYSPAWVAWSSFGSYLGWCPLGYNNRPYYSNTRVRNTVVVNNRWNYVPATSIVNRRRNYGSHNPIISGIRRVTTRPFHIKREDFRSAESLTRVIENPTVNRRRSQAVRTSAATLLATGQRSQERAQTTAARRVSIESRSTGTRAVSRYTETSNRVTQRARPKEAARSTVRQRGLRTRSVNTGSGRTSASSRPTRNTSRTSSRTEETRTTTPKPAQAPRRVKPAASASSPKPAASASSPRPATRSSSSKPAARSSKPATRSSKPAARSSKPAARSSKPAARSSKPAARSSKPAARSSSSKPAARSSNRSPQSGRSSRR